MTKRKLSEKDIQKHLDRYPFKCLCGKELPKRFNSYDHDGGIELEEYFKRRWVYITCSCGYDMALGKLTKQLEEFLKKGEQA